MDPHSLGPLFSLEASHPWHWGLPLAVAVPALVILSLGIARGRLSRRGAWAGVVVLPLLAQTLGHVSLFEQSKRVEFCASCHVMEPVVESLSGDESLAAVHVARGAIPAGWACYSCHQGYGMWGGVRAKVAGVEHMLRTVSQTERLPLRTYGPYEIRECLGCHSQTDAFRSIEDHRTPEVQAGLLAREIGCSDCHRPAHPAWALNGGEGRP